MSEAKVDKNIRSALPPGHPLTWMSGLSGSYVNLVSPPFRETHPKC